MRILDIGCGRKKIAGAIGVDFSPWYAEQTQPDKATACSSKLNVAEQISYSLQAVKPCPVRPETGPVSPPDDPFLFVERQLSFLSEQLTYLQDQGICASPEIERGRLLVESQKVGGGYTLPGGF